MPLAAVSSSTRATYKLKQQLYQHTTLADRFIIMRSHLHSRAISTVLVTMLIIRIHYLLPRVTSCISMLRATFITREALTFQSQRLYQHAASDGSLHQVNYLQAKLASYISTLPVAILIRRNYVPARVASYISTLPVTRLIKGSRLRPRVITYISMLRAAISNIMGATSIL